MCRLESKQRQAPSKRVKEITADSNHDFVIDAVYCVESKSGKETEALAVVNILSNTVRVKSDTGAEINVMPYVINSPLEIYSFAGSQWDCILSVFNIYFNNHLHLHI